MPSSALRGGGPPNDLCTGVVIGALNAGSSVTVNGDNTGATDTEGLGTPSAWEAFTTVECLNITVDYCGTTPAFGNAFNYLLAGCPWYNYTQSGDFNTMDCVDGNYTIHFANVPAGTYYYPVLTEPGSEGPYTITFSGEACTAVPPANDDCAGAIALAPAVTCVPTTGDGYGATASTPASACEVGGASASDDIWFGFVATDPTQTVVVAPSAGYDAVVELLSGTCGALTSIMCEDVAYSGSAETLVANGLTVGNTYYVRVFDWYLGQPFTSTVDVCVIEPAQSGPPNDQCGDVTPDMLGIGGGVNWSGTTVDATTTLDADPGGDFDDGVSKVWHAFTLNDCADVTLSFCGTAPVLDEVYLGLATACPSGGALLTSTYAFDCPDQNANVTFIGLSPGTYYYPIGAIGANQPGPYQVLVSATACAAPPVNDECTGAIELTPAPLCTPMTADVTGATLSMPASSCSGSTGNANDDVWYMFTATSVDPVVQVQGSPDFDAVVELMSGTCGTLTSLDCVDNTLDGETEEIDATGLTVGETYYVRVYDFGAGFPGDPTFSICVIGDPPTGVQDDMRTDWQVYPNPNDGQVSVVSGSVTGPVSAEVVDITGRILVRSAWTTVPGVAHLLELPNGVTPGLYTLRISTLSDVFARKIQVR